MTESFTITIAPDGSNFKIDVEGVVGAACAERTKVFELGDIIATEKKPEFYLETEDAITVNGEG